VERPEGPLTGPERPMLQAFLGWHRATLLYKCAGLTGEELAERSVPPSALSLLGLVRHMTKVERAWFRQRFAGEPVDNPFGDDKTAGRALDLTQVLTALEHADPAAGQARVAHPPLRAGREGALGSEPDAALSATAAAALTPRELDVLRLVAQGLSNPDIARRLVLSEHTVHRHLANILRKLGLSTRTAAAAWGARAGLV
jgi:DNA-binding CsgD family transcriptional regulator